MFRANGRIETGVRGSKKVNGRGAIIALSNFKRARKKIGRNAEENRRALTRIESQGSLVK